MLRLSYKETIETLKYWIMLVTGEESGGGKREKHGHCGCGNDNGKLFRLGKPGLPTDN